MELFYLTQNTRKPIDILYRTDVILLLICMILFCRYSYSIFIIYLWYIYHIFIVYCRLLLVWVFRLVGWKVVLYYILCDLSEVVMRRYLSLRRWLAKARSHCVYYMCVPVEDFETDILDILECCACPEMVSLVTNGN